MKACRIRRGHSQRAVAKEMSITQQAYSKIESDKSRRGLEFLLDLVRILEVGRQNFSWRIHRLPVPLAVLRKSIDQRMVFAGGSCLRHLTFDIPVVSIKLVQDLMDLQKHCKEEHESDQRAATQKIPQDHRHRRSYRGSGVVPLAGDHLKLYRQADCHQHPWKKPQLKSSVPMAMFIPAGEPRRYVRCLRQIQ